MSRNGIGCAKDGHAIRDALFQSRDKEFVNACVSENRLNLCVVVMRVGSSEEHYKIVFPNCKLLWS